ncbi:RDD family protein [Thalassoroseus pseudoceratinae]|uniref:RDD family protein n=1 Tax=Thalassoroseus pseudoceratinae TaxID=2713176 RepID=UPI00142417A5|nr:RDD family protein [Thalassoroseus pseudoceratinae]
MHPTETWDKQSSVSLALELQTPENIVLSYQLAGPASRCAAFLIDGLVRGGILIALMILSFLLADYLPGTSTGLMLLTLFFLDWGYFTISEGLFRGRTIGKRAMGLRVIHEHGHPVTFWGAMLRNFLRVVDGVPLSVFYFGTGMDISVGLQFIPVYGPALVTMILSPKLQRIGDFAAGTVVISERFGQLPREPVILSRIRPLERGEINHWKPDSRTLAIIDDYLSRRHVLSHERGHELCADLAMTMARKLEFKGDPYQLRDYPMSFLARAYVTFARRDDEDDTQWLPQETASNELAELEVVPRRTPRQHRTRL